jgi:hypothetical protein
MLFAVQFYVPKRLGKGKGIVVVIVVASTAVSFR